MEKLTNPTLERAARALADHFGCDWDTMLDADRETITGYCRHVLMAVLPELPRHGDEGYVYYDDLAAILAEGE